jgi:signal transduction histidine kinase
MSPEYVLERNFEFNITLIWLLVFIITIFLIFLWYFFLAKRRAEQRELENFEFSHLIIEGIETERQRISGEFHDTVLPLVRDAAVSSMIRKICTELMPPDFSRLPLIAALANLCDTFTQRSGIKNACSIEEGIDFSFLSTVNRLHVYRIVQESFTNIEKHSQAEKAALVIRKTGSRETGTTKGATKGEASNHNILICISDDGTGIDNSKLNEGMGMKTIRYRSGILGAKIDFIGEQGDGLMVRLEIPLLKEDELNAKY